MQIFRLQIIFYYLKTFHTLKPYILFLIHDTIHLQLEDKAYILKQIFVYFVQEEYI